MLATKIFYSGCWISMICILWFYTDFFVQYIQLLGIGSNLLSKYTIHITENPDNYFPDFLYINSLSSQNKFTIFISKLISCPFCLICWLSAIGAIVCSDIVALAPIYLLSLSITFQIKRMF